MFCRIDRYDELVEEVLDQLPAEVWTSATTRFLDPAMASGQFVWSIEHRLKRAGHSEENIRDRVFGFEKNKGYVQLAINMNSLIGTYEVRSYDSLFTWNSDMKFDVVVGNPPFQEPKDDGSRKDQASNLWSKFWIVALNTTTTDGHVALVTPTTWVSPSADIKGNYKFNGFDRLWDVFDSFSSKANITDVSRHFNGVGSSFGYVVVNKGGSDGLSFAHGVSTELGFLPLSGYDRVVAELNLADNLDSHFKISQCNSDLLRVSIPMTRSLSAEHIEILRGIAAPTAGSVNDGLYLYVEVPDDGTAERVRSRLIECLDILQVHCRFSGFLNIKILKMISFAK